MIQLSWSEIKNFSAQRGVNIQYLQTNDVYFVWAYDAPMIVCCKIQVQSPAPEESDQLDFETNFKAGANQDNSATVTTQFEKKDKTLKLASAKEEIDEEGNVTILLKIPGTPGSSDGRFISGGMAWFSQRHEDDRIIGVYFTDEDNILGGGAGAIVGSYTDDEMDSINQGWRIPPIGHVDAETLGFYGIAPSGFYMKIIGKSGNGAQAGKALYMNLEWGVKG